MIKYEGVHLVCLKCGRFNHRKEDCTLLERAKNVDPEERVDGNVGDGAHDKRNSPEKVVSARVEHDLHHG